jgi:peptide/nickel transport system permease protein
MKKFLKACGLFFKNFGKSIANFAKIIYKNKKSFVGAIILLVFFFFTIFGRIIFPYDETTSFDQMYLSPSWTHFFGTDGLGRDLFRMIVYGTKDVMEIAFLTALLTVGLGTLVGILTGYLGGWFDKLFGVITNLFMSLPQFPILLILSMFVTIKDNLTLAIMLSVFNWPGLARSIRSQIISLKERDFIQICDVMGLSKLHITFCELLPNIFSFVVINFINSMRIAITSSVGLMTLGLALFEPTNWGGIIVNARNSGALSIPAARLCIIMPILAIMLFQVGTILFSNGLDEIINPRLREN